MNGRLQFLYSLLLAAVIAGSCAGVGFAARFSPLMQTRIESDLARQRAANGLFLYNGGYLDDGDYVLLGQIPYDDYSRGGVYFIGSSETRFLLDTWELPPHERALIHNYALGDLRHRDALHFIRSLVDEHGLLAAGGEHTTIFLALSDQMTRNRDLSREVNRYVPSLFTRHGFYSFAVEDGVHRIPMSGFERFVRQERVLANRFLVTLAGAEGRVITDTRSPEARREHLVSQMGEDWEPEMRRQVGFLGETIDYLQQRGVHVRALFVPKATWARTLPYDAAYRALVIPILEARGVEIVDLDAALPDEDFGDAVHARYSGQQKMHSLARAMGLEALADMGTPVSPAEPSN